MSTTTLKRRRRRRSRGAPVEHLLDAVHQHLVVREDEELLLLVQQLAHVLLHRLDLRAFNAPGSDLPKTLNTLKPLTLRLIRVEG